MSKFNVGDKVRLNKYGRSIHVDEVHGLIVTVKATTDDRIRVDWSETGSRYRAEWINANRFELAKPTTWNGFKDVDKAIEAAIKQAKETGLPVKVLPDYA